MSLSVVESAPLIDLHERSVQPASFTVILIATTTAGSLLNGEGTRKTGRGRNSSWSIVSQTCGSADNELIILSEQVSPNRFLVEERGVPISYDAKLEYANLEVIRTRNSGLRREDGGQPLVCLFSKI
jgi:hypothetical protein